MRSLFNWLSLALLVAGCHDNPSASPTASWKEILGRNEESAGETVIRHPVYRARIPATWQISHSSPSESVADTTLPNAEFFIVENGEHVRVVVHTFPYHDWNARSSPYDQLGRWRRQIAPNGTIIQDGLIEVHAGFAGLYFEAKTPLGEHGNELTMMGWAMRLDDGHVEALASLGGTPADIGYHCQMAADYTIKVIGPSVVVEGHRQEIEQFAQSFELIQEIPAHS